MCCECKNSTAKRKPACKDAPKARASAKRKSAPKKKSVTKRAVTRATSKRTAAKAKLKRTAAKAKPKRTAAKAKLKRTAVKADAKLEDAVVTQADSAPKQVPVVESAPAVAKSSSSRKPIRLFDRVGIRDVAVLKTRLIDSLGNDTPIVVDLDEAETIDTAVVQLLVAFCNSAQKNGKTVSWKDSSGIRADTARVLGLEQYLAPESEPLG